MCNKILIYFGIKHFLNQKINVHKIENKRRIICQIYLFENLHIRRNNCTLYIYVYIHNKVDLYYFFPLKILLYILNIQIFIFDVKNK